MGEQPISLEEMASRVFVLRQRIRDEVKITGEKEEEDYKRTHHKPSWSIGVLFGEKKRDYKKRLKAFEDGLNAIKKKYSEEHPLPKELAELQKRCPHNYTHWFKIPEGRGDEARYCLICDKTQYYRVPYKV